MPEHDTHGYRRMNVLHRWQGLRLATVRAKATQCYRSHRVRRIAAIATIVLAVYGLLGFFAAPPIIKSQLQTRLGTLLDRPVSVQAVHLNPFTLRLELDGLHIADRDGKSAFVDIDQTVINASWTSLFRMAPVLDELRLQRPRLRLVRSSAQRFNFSDIIDRLDAAPAAPKAPPLRFALSNIRVHDGDIQFTDAVLKANHHVSRLELGIPFIANLPRDTDVFVRPLLSMDVDGSPLRVEGHTKPFADTRESTVVFRFDRLDLARYIAYAPTALPVAIPKGFLSGKLTLHFAQTKPTPQLQLTGTLQLDNFALNSRSGQPVLSLGKGTAELADVQPLQSRYVLAALALDKAQLHYATDANGHSNIDALTTGPAKPPTDAKAQPTDLRITTLTLTDSGIRYAAADGSQIDLTQLHGDGHGLSLRAAPPATLNLGAQLFGGQLALKGTLDLAKSTLAAALNVQQVGLAPMQAGALPNLAAQVAKGKLDAAGRLALNWGTPFNVQLADAHATISDFALQAEAKGRDAPLAWDRLDATIKQFDLAKHQAQLGTLKASGLNLDVERQHDQRINLVGLFARRDAPAKQGTQREPPWRWSIAHLAIDKSALAFTDLAVDATPVKIKVDALSGSLDDVSDRLARPSAMTLTGRVDRGSFSAKGTLQPLPTLADLQLDTQRLDIASFAPYISVPLNVTIASARLSSRGRLHYDGGHAEPRLTYQGDAALEQVRVQDKLTGDDFLRWRTLAGHRLDLSYGLGVPRMHVGSVVLSAFYARMIVSANGTLNLAEVVANPAAAPVSLTRTTGAQAVVAATPTPKPVASAPTPRATTPAVPAADIHIGGITLVDGQLNYTDNFIKPNYDANLTKLTGKIGAFGTTPGDPPAALSVQAALNDEAPVEIDGSINPLQPVAALDIKGKADGVELTGLSAYATKYTGYPITAGKLAANVHYLLDQRQLNADNHIAITQLSFGDRDESPGIRHLPVKLAVALLKDAQGNIDVNVPVSGSLDDPQFSVGGLVWRALGNLIAKAATSPFRLLGAAFGGGSHEDLGYVAFAPGSAVLDKQAQDRLGKIVAMLQQKPSLNLDISGRVDPAKDRDGLRKVTVDNLVRRAKLLDRAGKHADTSDAALATVDVTPDEYAKYLHRAYKADDFKGKPKNFIGLTKSISPEAMRSLMETNIPVGEAAMRALAQRRAAAVQAWLKGKLDDKRISLKAPVLDAKGITDKGATTRVAFGLH